MHVRALLGIVLLGIATPPAATAAEETRPLVKVSIKVDKGTFENMMGDSVIPDVARSVADRFIDVAKKALPCMGWRAEGDGISGKPAARLILHLERVPYGTRSFQILLHFEASVAESGEEALKQMEYPVL